MLLRDAAAIRALSRPDPAVRLYILAGPDEAGSRELAGRLASAVGKDATRVDFTPDDLHDDPGALAAEAAAIGLFGGARWIRVTVHAGSGDELVPACTALLAAPQAGNPVVVIGSAMTARAKLVKLAQDNPHAVAVVSYLPDAKAAAAIAHALAEPLGLTLGARVAEAIAAATGHDRGVIAREVEKLAIYCDAAPGAPQTAEIDAWYSIGTDIADDDVAAAVNVVLEGRLRELPATFAVLEATGNGGIGFVRVMAKRALDLAGLRAHVEGGIAPPRVVESYGKAIFFRERPHVTAQLRVWTPPAIARLIERLHALERAIKASSDTATLLLRAEMLDIARAAAIAGR